MNIETLKNMLFWCAVINYGILVLWFLLFVAAHDWLSGLHGKWFRLSDEQFNKLNYVGIMLFKSGIFLFNLVPYIALRLA